MTRSESGLSQSIYFSYSKKFNNSKLVCIIYNIVSIHLIPIVYSIAIFFYLHLISLYIKISMSSMHITMQHDTEHTHSCDPHYLQLNTLTDKSTLPGTHEAFCHHLQHAYVHRHFSHITS